MVTNIQVTGRMEQATTIHAWEASLNLRRPAPAKGSRRCCLPPCAEPLRAAVKAIDPAALPNLEEELKHNSAAR
ncbi:MAG: hypothetical protein DMG58_19195 [Acidobacteria bacterium]|nr:MAG: hypothetical protein DMG58_19195 [Acidobacteriota bacterium]PYT31847.1 MAG: hypothetical protein DMG57_03775 [Acidobacteriota bacterium]